LRIVIFGSAEGGSRAPPGPEAAARATGRGRPFLENTEISAILAEMEIFMAPVTLTASEFQDRVGEALDRSLSQPVLITRHGRPRNVVLSYDEYERLRARDRRAVRAEDLTDEDIAAIEASEMASEYEHLNAEFEEK
jgi:prevent-host-death family protein